MVSTEPSTWLALRKCFINECTLSLVTKRRSYLQHLYGATQWTNLKWAGEAFPTWGDSG